MKIINNYQQFPKNKTRIATIGMFDGLHLGHQKLLEKVVKETAQKKGESLLFSFDTHPRIVLFNDENIQLLSTKEEKRSLLQNTAIDYYVPLPFTKEFARMTAFEFVRDILVNQYAIDILIVGYDHHFGKNREGNFEQLKEFSHMFDFEVKQFSAVDFDGLTISSTKIRKALNEGRIRKANAMLGYDYGLAGKVIHGKGKGEGLGFPTANLEVEKYKLIPKNGVYIAEASIENDFYPAMVNIGWQPTLDGKKYRVEAHLLDFEKNIYGEILNLKFKKRLRDEKKFESTAYLQLQLQKDKKATQSFFGLR